MLGRAAIINSFFYVFITTSMWSNVYKVVFGISLMITPGMVSALDGTIKIDRRSELGSCIITERQENEIAYVSVT